MLQQIIHTPCWHSSLRDALHELNPDKVLLLTDFNVARTVLDSVNPCLPAVADEVAVISPGESGKNTANLAMVWERLAGAGCTRHSLMVNLGGGVVSDLGGFAAATFKRGIRFINIPTTLLAMADAAIGGKTGIDFLGYKNEVGAFAPAERVIVDKSVLSTLPDSELRSGFAEVVKMTLITSSPVYEELLEEGALYDPEIMQRAIKLAADEKLRIVTEDPFEKGVRRMLNFGHTAGHAYESYAAATGCPITHGEAVAHGMLAALRLSCERNGYPAEKVDEYEQKILKRYYSPLPFGEEAAPEIERLMAHDKKNPAQGEVNWVLLP